MIVRT